MWTWGFLRVFSALWLWLGEHSCLQMAGEEWHTRLLQLQMPPQSRSTDVEWQPWGCCYGWPNLSEYGVCFPRRRGLEAIYPMLSQELLVIYSQPPDLESFADLQRPDNCSARPKRADASPLSHLGFYRLGLRTTLTQQGWKRSLQLAFQKQRGVMGKILRDHRV